MIASVLSRVLLLVVVVTAGAGVRAQPREQVPAAELRARANALTVEAVDLKRRGDYLGAAAKFEEAYRLVPHPLLLYNIAQSHRLAGNRHAARSYYRKYLAVATSGPEVQLSRRFVAELNASIDSDPRPDRHTPDKGASLPSESHANEQQDTSKGVKTIRGGRRMTRLTWALSGASTAALGLGAYFTISARGDFGDCKERDFCTSNSEVDSIERRLLAGDLLLGASLATGAAAVLLVWFSADTPPPPVTVRVGRMGSGVAATLSF